MLDEDLHDESARLRNGSLPNQRHPHILKSRHLRLSYTRIYSLVLLLSVPLYSDSMSIRKGGGEWMPLLLPVEGRQCAVCKDGLYRDTTMLRGGWSRCTVCDEFVHYGCLASGKVSFLKARPRVCKACRAVKDGTAPPTPTGTHTVPTAVGS